MENKKTEKADLEIMTIVQDLEQKCTAIFLAIQ